MKNVNFIEIDLHFHHSSVTTKGNNLIIRVEIDIQRLYDCVS